MRATDRAAPTENDLLVQVEALLFAAGKPLTVHEIAGSLEVKDWTLVQRTLKKLHHNYASRQTALEIRRAGDGWAIQVKKDLTPVAHTVAAPDLSRRALKTLALIAYHQPIRQSRLSRMLGSTIYEDIPQLRDLGFVRASEKANTLELTTTGKFAEYFGFETTDRAKLKVLLEKGLGISRAPGAPPAAEDGSEEAPKDSSSTEGA